MKTEPGVKLLMKFRLDWLIVKAKELGILKREGVRKEELAREINKAQEKEQTRIWRAIADGGLSKRRKD